MAGILASLRRRHPLLAVMIICFITWLPGFFTLPPLDRDESRFAQATKQMLESHDFIDIRLGQDSRYQKPVAIYWLQAATTSAFGAGDISSIWTYRVPSLLGAFLAVAAVFWMVRASAFVKTTADQASPISPAEAFSEGGFAGAEIAFNAALILGLSVLVMSEAKIAKTDAMLLGMVAAAQAVLMRAYLSRRSATFPPSVWQSASALPATSPAGGGGKLPLTIALMGWGAFGFGVLVKGPVIAMVCAATIGVLVIADRDWRWLKSLRPALGIPLALAIILPWVIAIGVASHGAFFEKSLGQDFAQKLVGEQETHGAPPGYYALLSAFTFWPGTLLLLPALVHAWKQRANPPIRFLVVWAASTWIIFELVPTKLPHYVLPAYPALAALCAISIKAWTRDAKPGFRIAQYVSLALFAVVGIGLAAFVAIAPLRLGGDSPWWLYACAVAAMAAVLSVLWPALSCRPGIALARAGAAAILVYGIAGFATVPRLTDLWLSPRMAAAVARHVQPGDPPVVTAGYAEPSIQFLLGTQTSLDDGADAARAAAQSGGLVLVSDDQRGAFLAGIADGGARATALEVVPGLDYSRGRKMRITLYRIAPAPK
ncbi:MAG: glycosyltransferase family 39 protein [Alphaproteobacteria bacterium]|nr:glycosyltransferase family 39 protein [Alphaproteobacteria bacterium]